MIRWKAIFALLLLATWLPSALPCELKGILLPALECCSAENSGRAQKTDCKQCEICAAVPTTGYNTSEIRIVFSETSAPLIAVEVEPVGLLFDQSLSNVFPVTAPDLPTSWQFDLRAALPIRAPSFAS